MSKSISRERLVRFGVSMENSLVSWLDQWVSTNVHSNRSEALRSLVRKELSEEHWKSGESAVAVISLVYDHHKPHLLQKLSHLEHEHSDLILSAQHIHLDHHNCLEVIIAKGKAADLSRLTDRLKTFKGVKQAALSPIGFSRSNHAHPD